MKRWICLTICIVCLGALTVFGNSAPSYWEGFPYSDVLAVQQDSPIIVDSERLTFDFSEAGDHENWSPVARVLADYQMTNPTGETISVQMAFPFVAKLSALSLDDITVRADGSAVPYEIYIDPERIYGSDSGFHYDYGAIGNISNEKWALPGFGTDPKGKLYRYAVTAREEDRLELEIGFEVDPERTVLIAKDFHSSSSYEDGTKKLGAQIRGETKTEILILGQEIPLTCRVLTQEGKTADQNSYMLESSEEPADLREYLLSALRENLNKETAGTVSETQLTNLCLHEIERNRRSMGYSELFEVLPGVFSDHIFTLVYQVAFPPGSSRNVSVGYLTEGAMDRRVTVLPKFSYVYLLSPAKSWADFGSLEVEIRTPREAPYIIESSLDFQKFGQNRYNAVFDGLPESELTFTLYEKETVTVLDKARKTASDLSYFLIFFLPVFFVVLPVIAVFAVRSAMRRMRRKEQQE